VPDLSYSGLIIVDGRVASVEIARLLFHAHKIPPAERDRVRQDLDALQELLFVAVLVVARFVADSHLDPEPSSDIQYRDQAKVAAQQVRLAHHRSVLGLAAIVPVPARMADRERLTFDVSLGW
jgi:hypothetical protein